MSRQRRAEALLHRGQAAAAGALVAALVGVLAGAAACASAPPAAADPASRDTTVAPPPTPAPAAPGSAPTALVPRARGAAAGAQAREARRIIAEALRENAATRWQQRRALVFGERGAVFALDDAWALLAQAPRPARGRLLEAMTGALAQRASLDAAAGAEVAAAASRAGIGVAELYARRAGLDAAALQALVDGALSSTGALLGPVAGDVTLVPDVLAPPPWRARRPAPPLESADPIAAWALFYGAVPRAPGPDDAAAWSRALAVELRLSALSLRALLAPAPLSAAELDALASRALLDDAEALPGAAALLELDADGAVVERFIGLLRAPAVARALWAGETPEALLRKLERAPPADEEGFPEAFLAVARALPESY